MMIHNILTLIDTYVFISRYKIYILHTIMPKPKAYIDIIMANY